MMHTHPTATASKTPNLHLVTSSPKRDEPPKSPEPLIPGLYEDLMQTIGLCEELAAQVDGQLCPEDIALWQEFALFVANLPSPDRDAYESFIRYASSVKQLSADNLRKRMTFFWRQAIHLLPRGSESHVSTGYQFLANAISEYLNERKTAKDLANIRSKLNILLEWCESQREPIRTVNMTPSQVSDHFIWLEHEKPITAGRRKGQKGLGPRTLENHRIVLHCFFEWVVSKGWMRTNPVKLIRKYVNDKNELKTVQPLSNSQIRRMLDSLDENDFAQLRDKLIIMYLYDFGRRSEIVRIQMKDVDLTGSGKIQVWSKWSRFREVKLSHATAKLLEKYLDARERFLEKKRQQFIREDRKEKIRDLEHGYVFISSRTGKPMTESGVYRAVIRAAKRAGVHDINPAQLRKGAAADHITSGGTHDELRHLMNHRHISTTQRYTADARASEQALLPTDRLYGKELAS